MSIDRRQIFKTQAVNPVRRHHVEDEPERAGDGMDMAHVGYACLDRSSAYAFRKERMGMSLPVRDEGDFDPDEEQFSGQFVR